VSSGRFTRLLLRTTSLLARGNKLQPKTFRKLDFYFFLF
jgi:hypothetical protein